MTPELKAKWVATLRSGNYAQGMAYLRDDANNCCCLGVLCDITSPRGWERFDTFRVWRHGSKPDFPTGETCWILGNFPDT